MMEKGFVQTVTGPVPVSELGNCLMHEHLITGMPGYWGETNGISEEEVVRRVVAELETLKPFGVRTIVDASPIDLGRSPELLKEISLRSGMNVIMVTGYYTAAGGCSSYFSFRMKYGDAPQEAYELFKREVEKGVGDTGIRAGLLKVSTGNGEISPYENMFLEACARVSVETGTRIITHTEDGTCGAEQAKRLMALGVPADHIMIGHLNECLNIEDLFDVFELGVYGGFDRMGLQKYLNCPPEKYQMAMLSAMAHMGYADRIILSHDLSCVRLGKDWEWTPEIAEALKDWNYRHIFTCVIPFLMEHGMSEQQAYALVNDNPHAFLGES